MLEFEHSKQRALERYDFELSLEDYESMCASKGTVIYKEDNGGNPQKTMRIRYKGIDFIAVWSELRETITTFLPPERFSI